MFVVLGTHHPFIPITVLGYIDHANIGVRHKVPGKGGVRPGVVIHSIRNGRFIDQF